MNKVILNKKYADWTINTSGGNHGSVDSHIFSRFLSSELMGLWLLTFVTLISEENIFFLDKRKTKFFIRNCKSFLSSEMYLNYSNIQNKMGLWAGNIKKTPQNDKARIKKSSNNISEILRHSKFAILWRKMCYKEVS